MDSTPNAKNSIWTHGWLNGSAWQWRLDNQTWINWLTNYPVVGDPERNRIWMVSPWNNYYLENMYEWELGLPLCELADDVTYEGMAYLLSPYIHHITNNLMYRCKIHISYMI